VHADEDRIRRAASDCLLVETRAQPLGMVAQGYRP
jgi:hypothetical protein